MKKLKSSVIAKIIAWILLACSAIGVVLTVTAAVYFEDNAYYNITLDQAKKNTFEGLCNRYSAMAVGQMDQEGVNETYFADKNFKYGIIKAKNKKELNSLDLNKEKTYLERNFTEEVKLEDLNIFECYINDDTYFSSWKPDSLFGSYYISHSNPEWTGYGILEYVYEKNSGIFYYHCENGKYYPVQNILFTTTENDGTNVAWEAIYEFDKEALAYRLVSMKEGEALAETADYETLLHIYCDESKDNGEETITAEAAMEVLTGELVHFNEINASVLGYTNWNTVNVWLDYITDDIATEVTISVNDFETITGCEYAVDLNVENLSEKSEDVLVQKADFYIDMGENTLYEFMQETEGTNYYVVSFVPETLKNSGTDWMEGDLFVQADYLLEKAYEFRYEVFGICVSSLILLVASFVFLTAAAGHRCGVEGISGTWAEKIPLEIFWIICYAIEALLIVLAVSSAELIDDITSIIWMVLTCFFVFCGGCLAMGCYLDFVVRVKLGKWWESMLLWKICCWVETKCKKAGRFFAENTKLLWKVVIGYGMLSFAELLIWLMMAMYSYEMIFWLILLVVVKLAVLAFLLKCVDEMKKLEAAGEHFAAGDLQYQIDTSKMLWDFKKHGDNLNSLSDGLSKAVDARMKSEHFKTELITNVSHDIKTPLTSIINYVDLLKKEDITNETALEYIEVLDRQSARLKKLIEDLMEASKASTGNLAVNFEKLEAGVFMVQTVGEFEEKTSACDLELVIKKPEEPVYIMADGRHFWRVIDNLMNNICKYAQPGTRVYINLEVQENQAYIVFRNTSKYPLNTSSEELMERFVRGDSSRNTEGSGLGLSIARSLMELMHGKFELVVDGDLFKVLLTFDVVS